MLVRSALQSAPTLLVAIIMFVLVICFYLLGHRARRKMIEMNPDHSKTDLGSINGTLLGLLGLLLAFTFSMSNSRYDTRRQLVIEEANNIGTVILRTDVYPDSIRKKLRTSLKKYVEARISYYKAGNDVENTIKYYDEGNRLSKNVWDIVASYARVDDVTTRTSQMIPALNDMIDITTTRRAAGESTIPDTIMYFLFVLCFCSAFLLGYDHKDKVDWVVVVGFAIMLSATVFNIIDLDRPRSGLITMDSPNQNIIELREMFDSE